jgi:indole-3-glycerol phosphate synthase
MGILETICDERREAVARDKRERPASSLEREVDSPRPAFGAANGEAAGYAAGRGLLIAECKKASPSRGLLVEDYNPARLALAYERGGALMVSVLTEPRHFLGSDAHLTAVRASIGLPVLRKDFVVDPYQIVEAWAMGADAVLLIAAALSETEMLELSAAARELGLAVLAEARDEKEIAMAAAARPDAIGVNSRDLRDFSVDPTRAGALVGLMPSEIFRVAESGIRTPEDAAGLRAAGFDGFLVGEALAAAPDPEAATRRMAMAIGGDR